MVGSVAPVSSCVDGLFEALQRTMAATTERLQSVLREKGAARSGMEFRELELSLREVGNQMADQVAASVLEARHKASDFVEDAKWESLRDAPAPLRSLGPRETSVLLLGGTRVWLKSPYYARNLKGMPGPRRKPGKRGPGGTGLYPVLVGLGFIAGASPALALEAARESAQLSSYEETRKNMAARGVRLDEKTIRRLSRRVGDHALDARQRRVKAMRAGATVPSTGEFHGLRVAIEFDGGRIRTRVQKRGRRRKSGFHGFHTPWREPKKCTVFEIDEEGKKTTREPLYFSTMACWDDAMQVFAAECLRHGVQEAAEVSLGGDGARSIWDRVDWFIAAAGLEPDRVHKFVDYGHAAQHVHDAVKHRRWSAKSRHAWAKPVLRLLRQGKVEQVVAAIKELCVGRSAKAIRKEAEYFEKRKDLMRYAKFEQMGLPVGTGAVESAIRRVVNLRLKGPGIFWYDSNSERMLILRSYYKAGRWEELAKEVLDPKAAHRANAKDWQEMLARAVAA